MRLDHCFVAVPDLDRASQQMRGLGFKVSGRNFHTDFGSANHLIVFDTNYIELIGLVDAGKSGTAEYINLAAWLSRGGGWCRTAFEPGPIADAQSLLKSRSICIDTFETWERQADLGDGTFARAKFSTADIVQSATSRHDFFLCHHHNPQAVYSAGQMRHPNGAIRVIEGAIFVKNLEAMEQFLVRMFPDSIRKSHGGLEVKLPGSSLIFHRDEQGMCRSKLTILVADLGLAQSLLLRNDIFFKEKSESIEIPAELTPGFDLVMTDCAACS